jgi:nicotinamidase-related amidase
MSKNQKIGLEGLLRPEDSILVLIDHQPYQFTNLNSHEPTMIINNVIGLAKSAKLFNVPTILTTVIEERGGYIIKRKLPLAGQLPKLKKLPALGLGLIFALSRVVM